MIRSKALILGLILGLFVAVFAPVGAANADSGYRYRNFSVIDAGTGYVATATTCIFKIDNTHFRQCVQSEDNLLAWNTDPNFQMNALCWDLEINPDTYAQITCIGGSSLTLNDVANDGIAWDGDGAGPVWTFENADSPAFRLRFYGVGPGSVQNRKDDFATIG